MGIMEIGQNQSSSGEKWFHGQVDWECPVELCPVERPFVGEQTNCVSTRLEILAKWEKCTARVFTGELPSRHFLHGQPPGRNPIWEISKSLSQDSESGRRYKRPGRVENRDWNWKIRPERGVTGAVGIVAQWSGNFVGSRLWEFWIFLNFKIRWGVWHFCRAGITFHGQCPVKENTHQIFLLSVLLLSYKDMLIRMLSIVCHVIMKV